MRQIHLQPLGGVAGDMFAATLLDAFPEHRETALATAALAGVQCECIAHSDGTLTGHRFKVEPPHHHAHHHTTWRSIRSDLDHAALTPAIRAHAIAIFTLLAEAEARVHGIPPDEVTFHEVGAADSIADILAAAALIEALSPAQWSIASLPIGGGIVQTAHGPMPVPAPATARLLEGFAHHDDAITGERVTPTGAAILRYLMPTGSNGVGGGTLNRSGFGFGTRTLPGISNCLRTLVYDDLPATNPGTHRELAVISFEVDDQSGEDLAHGLDQIRATPGVHDVVVMTAFGKKSRIAMHVQVLTAPHALEPVVARCFQETTTIGLRTHTVHGRALPRRFVETADACTVKLVERPGEDGATVITGKAEADHVRSIPTHARRVQARQTAEQRAIQQDPPP